MTRCPSCRSDVGDRRVCPECSTSIEGDPTKQGSTGSASAGQQTARSQSQVRSAQRQPGGTPHGTARSRSTGQASARSARGRPLPTGLKLVCGLLVVSGLVSFGVGTHLQSIGSTVASYGIDRGGTFEMLGLVVIGIGLGQIAAGAGLWARKSWGWTATMAVAAAGALSGLALLSYGYTSTTGFVSLLFHGGVGWYVYRQRWRFQDDAGPPGGRREPNAPTRPQSGHATGGAGNRNRNG